MDAITSPASATGSATGHVAKETPFDHFPADLVNVEFFLASLLGNPAGDANRAILSQPIIVPCVARASLGSW